MHRVIRNHHRAAHGLDDGYEELATWPVSLDIANCPDERLVQAALANLIKGRTTLVVAHRLSTVRAADRIVVLEKGQVREVGSHDELLRSPIGLYSRLYGAQFATEDAAV